VREALQEQFGRAVRSLLDEHGDADELQRHERDLGDRDERGHTERGEERPAGDAGRVAGDGGIRTMR